MRSKLLHEDDGQRTFAIVLDSGEEAVAALNAFVAREHIGAAQFSAIGALSGAVLNYFDWERKKYLPIPMHEQVEVAALTGDVALSPEGKSAMHIHTVLGRRDLAEAAIKRAEVFVTNAVKHFKNEPRGKRRLHKRPNTYEIDRCRWWLDKEIAIARPRVIVALGATAVRALLGRTVSINRERDIIHELSGGVRLVITIHPSYVLRLRDETMRRDAYDQLVATLRRARATAGLGAVRHAA